MGLDMYLTGKRYLSKYDEKEKAQREELSKFFSDVDFQPKEVSFDVGCWRKANHIHKWFVDNIQEGEDDCKEYYVDTEKLVELLTLCKKVLETQDEAEDILPTQSGFFFGGEEYDEYYFETIKYTIEIIEKALKNKENLDFYYRSSW